jgi:hypothetical protein
LFEPTLAAAWCDRLLKQRLLRLVGRSSAFRIAMNPKLSELFTTDFASPWL